MRTFFVAAFAACLSVSVAHGQSNLENPQANAKASGIGLVSGWKCTGGTITVQFDSRSPEVAAYGTSRPDTQGVCGDQNNGFGLLFNFNRLGDGTHTVKVFDNGALFAERAFTVTTLGQEFATGLSKTVTINDFPTAGQTTTLQWDQAQQNFVIAGRSGGGGSGEDSTLSSLIGTWEFVYTIISTFHDQYEFTSIQHPTTFDLLVGHSLKDGSSIGVARVQEVTPGSPLPYQFGAVHPSILGCDGYFFDKTGPNTVTGVYVLFVSSGGSQCGTMLGAPDDMVGTRISAGALSEATQQEKGNRYEEAQAVKREENIEVKEAIQEFMRAWQEQ